MTVEALYTDLAEQLARAEERLRNAGDMDPSRRLEHDLTILDEGHNLGIVGINALVQYIKAERG